jgi:hypothetical protein
LLLFPQRAAAANRQPTGAQQFPVSKDGGIPESHGPCECHGKTSATRCPPATATPTAALHACRPPQRFGPQRAPRHGQLAGATRAL